MTKIQIEDILRELYNIQSSWGWKILQEDLKDSIEILECDIFDLNPDLNKREYTWWDLLKLERLIKQSMVSLVDDLIRKYEWEKEVM